MPIGVLYVACLNNIWTEVNPTVDIYRSGKSGLCLQRKHIYPTRVLFLIRRLLYGCRLNIYYLNCAPLIKSKKEAQKWTVVFETRMSFIRTFSIISSLTHKLFRRECGGGGIINMLNLTGGLRQHISERHTRWWISPSCLIAFTVAADELPGFLFANFKFSFLFFFSIL